MSDYPLRLLIHGGAGMPHKSAQTPQGERAHHKVLRKALTTGFAILKKKGSSLDAVREAVKVMEDSPLFNAGYGSVLTQKGKVELDAAIMDGSSLKAGAVAAVSHVRNPIEAAQLIFEHSKHVMLIGRHAENFVRRHGMKLVDSQSLITAAQLKRWQELKDKKLREKEQLGTVGAVALDCRGNLAAATSTGGIMNKAPGRVGDSPIIGAGTYADNETCAVSATGQGEYFIRLVFSYDIAAQLRYEKISLAKAGAHAMQRLTAAKGKGGFIALSRKGEMIMAFNTEAMYHGSMDEKGMDIKLR